jgi:hypothetical protein
VVALVLARGPAGAPRAKTAAGDTPLDKAEKYNTGPGRSRSRLAAEEIKALLRAAMR